MKKFGIIILLLVSSTLFTGCNSQNNTNNSINSINMNSIENQNNSENSEKQDIVENSNTEQDAENIDENKSLVLYFSPTGNTKRIANFISEITNSDIVEIIPEIPYTEEDLSYHIDDTRANNEQNDPEARPQISTSVSTDGYDTIYLGYPIWWGTNPKIILTLIENFDFSDKEIVLFCTSGSSGIGQSETELKGKGLNVVGARRFSASSSKEEVQSWLESL